MNQNVSWTKMFHKCVAVLLAISMVLSMGIAINSSEANAKKSKVKSIKMVNPATSTLVLKKGEIFRLKVKVNPGKAALIYTSSKNGVVSVNKKGVLKAKKPGKAKITVKAKNGTKKISINVTVYKKFTKVKKVKLNMNKASLSLDKNKRVQLKASVSPGKATVKKIKYISSDAKIASVSGSGAVTAKKAGSVIITAYAADGRGAKATCKVTVKTSENSNSVSPAPLTSTSPSIDPVTSQSPSVDDKGNTTPKPTLRPVPVPTPALPTTPVTFIEDGKVTLSMYIDEKGDDYDGLSLVAESVKEDFSLVADVEQNSEDNLQISTDKSKLSNQVIIAGSIGNNDIIDQLIQEGKLDVSNIKDKWETYTIQLVDSPVAGVDQGIVVCGSDKRGTIYGMYHISEAIGVSPWVYWSDSVPEIQKNLTLGYNEFGGTSKEPSVKYRGIFINDEYPSLGKWAKNKFGDPSDKYLNADFYNEVYKLILRCKGNYLWPAMWQDMFSRNGKSEYLDNAELADKYGIVMGTSHHEPMCRAGQEWGYDSKSYGGSRWNFDIDADALTAFWNDGVKRNGQFENIITLGMRGENDSALNVSDTVEGNIDYLKRVITAQKNILADNNLSDAPTMFAVYKEIETYWNSGLRDWDGMDGITVLLSDDNFGNVRSLPTDKYRDRDGGWGMYYHFDYHGAPTSYEWINSTPLNKIWDQMTMAYDSGVDDIWIVNVGDIKPMEMQISYFLDLAYDIDTWSQPNKTEEYSENWVKQQFGDDLDETGIKDVSSIIEDYTDLNAARKPEVLKSSTYSIENYNEAMEVLKNADDIINAAEKYKKVISEESQAAYYQLVYYPAVASANVVKMQIYSALNNLYYEQGTASANVYAALIEKCILLDQELEDTYNNNMPVVGDKWKYMMSDAHVGFTEWNQSTNKYPEAKYVDLADNAKMSLFVQGNLDKISEGTADLPEFTDINQDSYYFTLENSGRTAYEYTVEASDDWIKLSSTSGKVISQDTITVSIDWTQITADSSGKITVKATGNTITLNVNAKVLSGISGPENMFIESDGVVSMSAEHFSDRGKGDNDETLEIISQYGRTGNALKMISPFYLLDSADESPYVEYCVYVTKDGTYSLDTYLAPSNNSNYDDTSIYYSISVDGGEIQKINSLSENFEAGNYREGSWAADVTNNIRISQTNYTLSKGTHTIRIYVQDPAFVLQKLVLYRTQDGVKTSYLGAKESYYIGKNISDSKVNVFSPNQYRTVPCSLNTDAFTVDEENAFEEKIIITKSYPVIAKLNVEDAQDAVLELKCDGKTIDTLTVSKAGDYEFKNHLEIGTGEHTYTVSAVSGSATIQDFNIRLSKNWAYPENGATIEGSADSSDGSVDALTDSARTYTDSLKNRWRAKSFPASVTITFDEEKSVSKINLFQQCGSTETLSQALTSNWGYMDKFTVEYYDGSDWHPLATETDNNKVWYAIELSEAIKAQKIRVNFDKEVTGGMTRLTEIEVWE